MSNSQHTKRIREAAKALGFVALGIASYDRRVPGECTNEQWFSVELLCPCGKRKRLHMKRESVSNMADSLREHLKRDGLL